MSIKLAFKAFFKALKEPAKARRFVEETEAQESTGDASHLRLLSLLQHSGRFIDFLKEDISHYNDAQVGGAVRKIHQECGKTLEDLVTLRPLMSENEGSRLTVPVGYDANALKLVGNVRGEPPYQGILVHKGWKAHKRSLPKQKVESLSEVICPAEIEIK